MVGPDATAATVGGAYALTLKLAEALAARLLVEEDCRLKPYRDTKKKLTIGIGRNLTDRGISRDEAEYLLANDINLVIHELDVSFPWWTHLNEARQLVLADMCFNLGGTKLKTFKRTLAAIQRGDYAAAAAEMRASLWARQVGDRAERLAVLMETGTFA